ncbi:MAG: NADH-quinone oxidoreductase subunit NuoF [bacterium]
MKITNLTELNKLKEESLKLMQPRFNEVKPDSTGGYPKEIERHVIVCAGTGCVSCGSLDVLHELEKEVKRANMTEKVKIIKTGCVGFCVAGPVLVVYPDGIFYQKVELKDVKELIESHLKEGKPVNSLLWIKPKSKGETVPLFKEISFFKFQKRIVLANSGLINPEDIDEYIALDGYQAMAKVIKMTQEEVINEVKISKLRGRGGAGFSTGLKWEFAKKSVEKPKYVVCNGDEGDPGAFMDRNILERDPQVVIEGMTICGYAIGAEKGYMYVRSEYPLAIKRLEIALNQAKEYGLLGENILGTNFNFDIEIRPGAGAFVCGEETALINSIEGKRGEPRPRPPYPAVSGLWGKPTNINNVETFANIPWIIRNGGNEYSKTGTEKSSGTKIFALTGDIVNTGLVEVPMGTTLKNIIYNVGGGIDKNRKFKAAQLGGPSGGCIPIEHLETPIDYDSLTSLGAIMGSGGLIVMDNKACMVNVAKFFMEFVQDESCGKCPPCRVGTKRMLEILERIIKGEGKEEDIELLIELGNDIKMASLCGLGQTATNPVLSTIRYFREEYERHIKDKICPSGVCQDLLRFEVDKSLCKKCGLCFNSCPEKAIFWEKGEVAKILKDTCIKCRKCIKECPFNAIY